MGCATSKLDNLPAVALCRDRCKFLDQALLSSHALADAHFSYVQSLNALGSALHRLFDGAEDGASLYSKIQDLKSPPSSSNSDEEDSDEEFGSLAPVKARISPYGNLMFSSYDSARVQSPSPPPTSSSWDFLNFFDTYERYESVFTTNWDRDGGVEKVGAKKNRGVVEEKDGGAKKLDPPEKKNQASSGGNTRPELGVSDVMREIKASFEKASESGKLLSHSQRIGFSKDSKTSFRGLSSTIKKLCIWEQKLHLEVKAEERLRMTLEKKCRQLKHLVEKKTDAGKVDSVRTLIRNLSIKLKVSIQVVDRISITISTLRDEEFSTEITELIHGLLCMWKLMLDCHKHQSEVLAEASRSFGSVFNGNLDDARLEAAIEVKLELQNWRASFCNWIATQNNCVKALNGWLLRCLLYEPDPEDTPANDVWLPFSPARIGAPPVFVICNRWSETVEKFSGKEVSETMHGLISVVDGALQQQNEDLQRMVIGNKDLEKKMKTKKLNEGSVEKKTVAVAAESLHKKSSSMGSEVQSGLKEIFSALVRFSGDSIKAYEELCEIMAENR